MSQTLNEKIRKIVSKREKAAALYKRGGADTVIFVPATPNSKLKKKYNEEIEKSKLKVKVVEL